MPATPFSALSKQAFSLKHYKRHAYVCGLQASKGNPVTLFPSKYNIKYPFLMIQLGEKEGYKTSIRSLQHTNVCKPKFL